MQKGGMMYNSPLMLFRICFIGPAIYLTRSLDTLHIRRRCGGRSWIFCKIDSRLGVDCWSLRSVRQAVSIVGTIGFVGLVAPHIARRLVGFRHLPLLVCFRIIRRIASCYRGFRRKNCQSRRKTFQSGLIVALIGTPYLLYLLVK